MAAKKPRKYAFVPKLLARTALAGAIPACALATANACGGTTSTPPPKDSGSEQIYTVAAVAYPAYEAGRDAFGVAAVAYPAYESGVPDAKTDGPSDATAPDVMFTVAAVAYPAYEAGTG